MKCRKLKLSRVCGVTHAADTCGEFRVVRHPDNTSPNILDVSAVCVTAHTLNNFNFRYFIIKFILLYN